MEKEMGELMPAIPMFEPTYDKSRLSIDHQALILRLQDNALGRLTTLDPNGNKVKYSMSTNDIRCAEILLRKVLPDHSTLTLDTGKGNLPIVFNITA